MKQIKNKIVIWALSCGLLISGCDDFLEPSSTSEFVPKDAGSLNELLLGEAYPRNDIDGMNVFLNLMDDDITAMPYQVPQDGFNANRFLAAYTWQPDMFKMMEEAGHNDTNMYERYYQLILGANAVIDYIDQVVDEKQKIDYVLAQAYALRGFLYFKLVNIFGAPVNSHPETLGVPLKLNSGVEIEEGALARRTVKQVYDQIVNDLLEAERLYKTLSDVQQFDKDYRTSLPMVQLMLSRTYLYLEDWKNAADYAELVMNDNRFQLLDLNAVATTTEIGQPFFKTYHAYSESSEVIWLYGSVKDMGAWVMDYAGIENPRDNNRKMHAYFKASDELLACFEDTDLRKERYIVRKPVRDNRGVEVWTPMAIGKLKVSIPEYTGISLDNYYKPVTASGVFGRSLRLSEAYLNYAEAKAMMYQEGSDAQGGNDAVDALDILRSKRFATEDFQALDITDANELVQFVREERRRELCFEDHRWYDIRRWGMKEIKHVWYDDANTRSIYTLTLGDKGYTVPIPDEAMELNAALVQNDLPAKRTPVVENIPVE